MFVVHTSNCHGQNCTRRAIYRLGIDTLIANILVNTATDQLAAGAAACLSRVLDNAMNLSEEGQERYWYLMHQRQTKEMELPLRPPPGPCRLYHRHRIAYSYTIIITQHHISS